MIIGFHKQFVSLIKKRKKLHTIRADKHNRWKAGMKMHMATGVRTKKYKCFKEITCKSVQEIRIIYYNKGYMPNIYIDALKISNTQFYELVIKDGFHNPNEFLNWFNKSFIGKIIHWTDKKY